MIIGSRQAFDVGRVYRDTVRDHAFQCHRQTAFRVMREVTARDWLASLPEPTIGELLIAESQEYRFYEIALD